MKIRLNTPPVRSGICAKCTNLTQVQVVVAALIAATIGLHSGLSQAAESAGPPAMAPMAAPPAGAYKLDKAHASLVLRASHMGFSTYTTRFSRFDADLTLDPRNLSASRVVTTIDASSFEMDAAPQMCLDIMKGPQMLDTAKFPQIVFKSEKIRDDRGEVDGDIRHSHAAWRHAADGARGDL